MTTAYIVLALCLLAICASGLKSAAFYSGKRISSRWIHPAQFVETSSIVWAGALLFWGEGIGPFLAAGAALALLSDVAFQGFINVDFGWPFIDLHEADHAGSRWNLPIGDTEYNMPKFSGWGRIVQLVVGAGALVYLILTVGG